MGIDSNLCLFFLNFLECVEYKCQYLYSGYCFLLACMQRNKAHDDFFVMVQYFSLQLISNLRGVPQATAVTHKGVIMFCIKAKLTWKGLLVSSYCHRTVAIGVRCTCASPLHNVLLYVFTILPHPNPLLTPRVGKYNFFHCDESVTAAEVDLMDSLSWLTLSNHLICFIAPTLQ